MAMAWEPNYVEAGELAEFVRIGDALDDAQLNLAIATASRAVDRATRRQFGQVAAPEARYYTPRYDALRSRWVVPVDDLMTVTGLLVAFDQAADGTYTAALTDYVLLPANAVADARPWTELAVRSSSATQPTDAENCVRVTARWGWPSVPAAVREATLLQASRLLARRDSPYGVAGSPDAGSELRLLARMDPDVEVALRPYKRRGGVVFA